MKTMKKDGKYKRLQDALAEGMLKHGLNYCPKSEYKSGSKTLEEAPTVSKNKKTKKNKA